MTNLTLSDVLKSVCIHPGGLFVVAGPKKSGRTNTMRLIESAVSQMDIGTYIRIGNTPPEDDSIVQFIETFKMSYNPDKATDDEAIRDLVRYQQWEHKIRLATLDEAAGVFIDDLDQAPAGLSSIVITMALMESLTVVSVEADSAKEAMLNLFSAARIDKLRRSLLNEVPVEVVLHKPSVDARTGDDAFTIEVSNGLEALI
jgi:hypothetical protein